jgi:hypothetical protein
MAMTGRAAPFRGAVLALVVLSSALHAAEPPGALRPPAVPLVTHHPYFSVWSFSDKATDDWSRHWTGSVQALCGLARIDGTPYRFLGRAPEGVPAMEQVSLRVTPTRTFYTFRAGDVELAVTFTSPLLPKDVEVLTRPVTYVDFAAKATKPGASPRVEIYLDITGEWAVDKPEQEVAWRRLPDVDGLDVLTIGTTSQKVLNRSGDNLRIDWGHAVLAVPRGEARRVVIASDREARDGFASGTLPREDDRRIPRQANDAWPVLAAAFDLSQVGTEPVARHVLLAYDEEYAMQFLGESLRPYWRRDGRELPALLTTAEREHDVIRSKCEDFDGALTADLRRVGGERFARLCTLAYRQAVSAHGMAVDAKGQLVMLSKENFSNGCIGTVDLLYPAAPLFLLLDPDLLEAQTRPVLDYARSGRWKFPFAPHDLGQYPLANGQVYGGGEKTEENQMPVEESGNLLIVVAALCEAQGSTRFAEEYWPLLESWAKYLETQGFDPANQLCTDDFAGHLAHNANLSIKAIVGLRSFAELCEKTGRTDEAKRLTALAKGMVNDWMRRAADGDHYRLAFDRPGTWSQKYNLVWDKILGLDLFPPELARTEVAYYLTKQNEFGLPLDNRSQYTKLDWIFWTATLAENRRDFNALIAPTYRFADRSPSRVPLTDWYWTHDAKQRGFQARSVVGGLFMPMLADRAMWKKWRTAE